MISLQSIAGGKRAVLLLLLFLVVAGGHAARLPRSIAIRSGPTAGPPRYRELQAGCPPAAPLSGGRAAPPAGIPPRIPHGDRPAHGHRHRRAAPRYGGGQPDDRLAREPVPGVAAHA